MRHNCTLDFKYDTYTEHIYPSLAFCLLHIVPSAYIPHGPHALAVLHAEFFSKLERHVSRGDAFLTSNSMDEN